MGRKAFLTSEIDLRKDTPGTTTGCKKRDVVGTANPVPNGKIGTAKALWLRMEAVRTKGRRWVISTKEEMRLAAIDVANAATRKLSIFTHDLEPGIYDDPDFLEIVKHLVLSQSYARIRVLIADPARAIKTGNNLVHLGRRLNTYIEFRHVREDLRTHAESFFLADETALVYRLQASRWEGIVDTYEPAVARMYGKMFDEIWLASEVEIEFRQLGI